MRLRRATWDSVAFAILDHERLAVAYKHHLDRVPTNPGEEIIFYNYRAKTSRGKEEGRAWEWGMDFKLAVERSGKIIIAEPEWEGGKLVPVGYMECCGKKLTIEIIAAPFETIKIDPSTRRYQQWEPDGYADAKHVSNHESLRC